MASEHDLAERLLRLARDDEAAARAMLDVVAVTDAIVGFHAQQAVEKALKAVLAFHGVEVPFAFRRSPFGVRLRYGELDEMVPVARGLALGWAEQSIVWARLVLDGTA